jgi:hypothetical protein
MQNARAAWPGRTIFKCDIGARLRPTEQKLRVVIDRDRDLIGLLLICHTRSTPKTRVRPSDRAPRPRPRATGYGLVPEEGLCGRHGNRSCKSAIRAGGLVLGTGLLAPFTCTLLHRVLQRRQELRAAPGLRWGYHRQQPGGVSYRAGD